VNDLLERWRSGALRFVGVPSGAGSPVAIPPDACPSRDCLDIAGGSLSGPRGVFSNVRVRSTTSLPLDLATRVFGPWETVVELERLEARGFIEPFGIFIPERVPSAEEERASELRSWLWRALIADLTAGRLCADGRDPKAAYSAGRAVLDSSDWPLLEAGLRRRDADSYDIDSGGITLRDVRVRWPGDDTIAGAPAAARVDAPAAAEPRPVMAGAARLPGPVHHEEAFAELVVHLRGLAEASPEEPTLTYATSWEEVQQHPRWGGVITEVAFRQARADAFEGFPAWRRKGRRPSAKWRRK
jgi:hypothetical protein